MIDFALSNLSNSGVNQIKVIVRKPHGPLTRALGIQFDHYNINSKRGKLHVLPAKNMNENDFYSNDINSFMYNMEAMEENQYAVCYLNTMQYGVSSGFFRYC